MAPRLQFAVFVALAMGSLGFRSREGRSTPAGAQLRTLLHEEQTLREKLEARVRDLWARSISLNSTLKTCTCGPGNQGNRPSSHPVAFTSTLNNAMSSLTKGTNFSFPNVITNEGDQYMANNGTFVAPASGLYGFSLSIFMYQGYQLGMQLVKNGQPAVKVRTGHYYSRGRYDRKLNMGTNYAMLNLAAGDSVWVQYIGESDSARIWGENVTTFTGYLLHEY